MRVQLDRFEDNEMAVLLLLPEGRRSFDLPREMLPGGAGPGDVYEVRFEKDEGASERMLEENRSLLDELLGRNKDG